MSRCFFARSGVTKTTLALLAASAVVAGIAWAAAQPDQLVTGKKLIVKIKAGNPAKNKIVYVS